MRYTTAIAKANKLVNLVEVVAFSSDIAARHKPAIEKVTAYFSKFSPKIVRLSDKDTQTIISKKDKVLIRKPNLARILLILLTHVGVIDDLLISATSSGG
ncbi:hypothetical protein CGG88_24170 [Vibrio parahaemolyticus]|nr:hypothetical protein CGG88_24170 [Vibrio parahaemolyticus]